MKTSRNTHLFFVYLISISRFFSNLYINLLCHMLLARRFSLDLVYLQYNAYNFVYIYRDNRYLFDAFVIKYI